MRIVLLISFIISLSAHAQLDTGTGALGPCTQATFTNGGTYNCGSLTLSSLPAFIPNSTPIIIKVTGIVTISGSVDFSGLPGATVTLGAGTIPGGDGGPGNAGDGGGHSGFVIAGGSDASTASGLAANGGAIACEDGGGGGGFAIAGNIGSLCGSGNGPGAGGSIVPSSEFSLTGILRGGFGGGAGGDSSGGVYGSGGGGGGFIKIISGGDITITALGSLLADGGAGGSGTPDGGGGGGGSGGVIWMQTLSNIIVDGLLRADGGIGGSGGAGAAGGLGGHGIIRLEDIDGVVTGLGAGALPVYVDQIVVSSGSASSSLKSDISCGMIKPSEDKNHSLFFQMIMGFLIASGLSSIINRSKFFSKTQV